MKAKIMSGEGEESKLGFSGASIAGIRQRLADGGSGGPLDAPIIIENCVPPTRVSAKVRAHENGGQCIAFGPQGKKIASGGKEGIVKIWKTNLSNNDCKSLRISNGPISCLAYNTGNSLLAAGDCNSQISFVKLKP